MLYFIRTEEERKHEMNHYDDRASYFAMLNEQFRYLDCLDSNNQADIGMSAYGGQDRVVQHYDIVADV